MRVETCEQPAGGAPCIENLPLVILCWRLRQSLSTARHREERSTAAKAAGTGGETSTVRLPAAASVAAAGGLEGESQTDSPAVPPGAFYEGTVVDAFRVHLASSNITKLRPKLPQCFSRQEFCRKRTLSGSQNKRAIPLKRWKLSPFALFKATGSKLSGALTVRQPETRL